MSLFYGISDGLTSNVRTSTAHREGGRDEVGFVYIEGKEEEQNLNDINILVKKKKKKNFMLNNCSSHFYGPL